jgi:hypothetical protein
MEISQRQLAANRANALKSTGPRSAEGKARSARNAITHGLTCAPVAQASPVLSGEDEAAFIALRDQLTCELSARGTMQREIVDQLAQAIWRLRRIPGIEDTPMERSLKVELRRRKSEQPFRDRKLDPDPPTIYELLADQFQRTDGSAMGRLELYRSRLLREQRSLLRELRKLQEETVTDDSAASDEKSNPSPEATSGRAENYDVGGIDEALNTDTSLEPQRAQPAERSGEEDPPFKAELMKVR